MSQVAQIQELSESLAVKIEVKRKGRINRIRVEGTHQDRATAVLQITHLLRQLEDEQKFEEHASVLYEQVLVTVSIPPPTPIPSIVLS